VSGVDDRGPRRLGARAFRDGVRSNPARRVEQIVQATLELPNRTWVLGLGAITALRAARGRGLRLQLW